MTEKQYGGNTGRGKGEKLVASKSKKLNRISNPQKKETEKQADAISLTNKEKILKAGGKAEVIAAG